MELRPSWTYHAFERAHQRDIPLEWVRIVLEYGRSFRKDKEAIIYQLTGAELLFWIDPQQVFDYVVNLDQIIRLNVILSANMEDVLTVYYE